MATKKPSQIRIQDPLSKVTRAERKTLLGVSALGVVIAKSGFVPSKISALGIDFDRTDQAAILKMLAGVALYFLAAFVVYAASDFIAWRVSFHDAIFDRRRRFELSTERQRELDQKLEGMLRRTWTRAIGPMSVLRAFFEFLVPVIVGTYAVITLASTPAPKSEIKAPVSTTVTRPAVEPSLKSSPTLPPK